MNSWRMLMHALLMILMMPRISVTALEQIKTQRMANTNSTKTTAHKVMVAVFL